MATFTRIILFSIHLVGGHNDDMETRYATAYYQLYYCGMTGKSLWWLFQEFWGLGLLVGISRLNVETKAGQSAYERVTICGLPFVNRMTPSVELALELAMNVGYECHYAQDGEMIHTMRICSRTHAFHRRYARRFMPYWWYIRDAEDLRVYLSAHLQRNLPRSEEVIMFFI